MTPLTISKASVILFNPDWRKLTTPGRFRTDVPYFPLELMYIEGGLNEAGIESVMADLWGGTISEEEFVDSLNDAEYLVITTAPTYVFWRDGVCDVQYAVEEIERIKKVAPGIKVIVIGPQGTVLPEDFHDTPVDYLIRGEPDWVVPELIQKLSADEDVKNLPGVCYQHDGKLQIVESKTEMKSLDTLPLLSFASIQSGEYGQVVYETSRGCVYDCAFCCRDGFRKTMRLKSMDRIKQELQQIKEHGYQYIFFIDELFGPKASWHQEFCEMIKPMHLKWSVQTRQECLSPKRVENMINAGCVSIEIGLESADAEVAKRIGKNSNLEKLTEVIRKACELNIEQQIRLFCIIGSPGESIASVRKTENYLMQFIDEPKVQADLHPMIPIPGTEVWRLGQEQGLDLESWSDVTNYVGIVDNEFETSEEVIRLCDMFEKRWSYERQKENLSKSIAGRLALFRMKLTMLFPSLSGMRSRVFANQKK